MRIAVVTGNPKPASRTHNVALAVAAAVGSTAVGPPAVVIDLAEHAADLFDWSSAELTRLTAEVAAAEPEAAEQLEAEPDDAPADGDPAETTEKETD